jgi:hypothetical protein
MQITGNVAVKESTKRAVVLGVAILFVLVFQVSVLFLSWQLIPSKYPHHGEVNGIDGPGEFGEMFGAANALFAGVAFAAVIISQIIQRWDMTQAQNLADEANKLANEANKLANEAQKRANEANSFTVAGLLFNYYTKEISSLRRAEAKEKSKTINDQEFINKLGKRIKDFRQKHRTIRNKLEGFFEVAQREEERFSEKEQEKLEEHLKDSGAGDQADASLE